jgi:cytoskeleton protein RodZ
VDTGLGATLREARNRRRIDLSEVEAATKIRTRYLRAMENEEWDVLPGGPYARGFIRTYATFLGLDGDRLADDYRHDVEAGGGSGRAPRPEPAVAAPRPSRRGPRVSTGAWTAIVTVGLIAVLVAVGLSSESKESGKSESARVRRRPATEARARVKHSTPRTVSVRLRASAEVWVCLLDAAGKKLIDGRVLTAGTREGPFHSASFTVSFGNGEVAMKIDGHKASIPVTAEPVGYSIDSAGMLERLPESQRPTCA